MLSRRGLVSTIIASFSLISFAQEQQYIFNGSPADTFTQNYRQQQDPYVNTQQFTTFQNSPQGFQQIDSYLPQKDLQTSELPLELQQRLPQYQFPNVQKPAGFQQPKVQQFNFHTSTPQSFHHQQNTIVPKRYTQNIIPSTHRPNYSHLFSQTHSHNPSQGETFLGQITIQSPAELPPEFNNRFKPQWNQGANKQRESSSFVAPENDNQNIELFGNKGSGFSSGNDIKYNTRAQVKDFYVNNNGDVFITTKTPFSPKPTLATTPRVTTERRNRFSPSTKNPSPPQSFNIRSNKKPFLPKNYVSSTPKSSFDLEPLLEDPINETNISEHNDDVEIIKFTTLAPKDVLTTTQKHEEEVQEEEEEDYQRDTGEYYDYETTEGEEEVEHTTELNVQEEQETEEHNEDVTAPVPVSSNGSSYEVLTMKPSTMVKDDNFKEFIDSAVIDNTTEDPQLSNTETLNENSTDPPVLLGNAVISVVTTKSVVNNTVIGPATSTPDVQLSSPVPVTNENSTDTWVIVASVQTSRSVSGARYLPSPVVEQEVRTKLLNEPFNPDEDDEVTTEEEEGETTTERNSETTIEEELPETVAPLSKLKTSTESLIDKLDRVQSDLSSGFLTGGFKNGNNIALITERMSEKMDETTLYSMEISSPTPRTTTTTTVRSTSLPPVVIKKFSPNLRPTTTQRPKKLFEAVRDDDFTGLLPPGFRPKYTNKRTTTTQSPVDDIQSDEPTKTKNATTGRSSGISYKNKVTTVDDVSAFLPPGYKAEKEETEASKSLVDELLSKIKFEDVSSLLPKGYKPPEEVNSTTVKSVEKPKNKTKSLTDILSNAKQDDISKFLPTGYSGYKSRKFTSTTTKPEISSVKSASVTAFVPKANTTEKATKSVQSILSKAKPVEDISALLPPGYKPAKSSTTNSTKSKGVESLLKEAQPVDISAFLPPGFKLSSEKPQETSTKGVPPELLPPGYKTPSETQKNVTNTSGVSPPKVVFPSRPGGGTRKPIRLSTPRSSPVEGTAATAPTIHKGWPSRATTEFTGWPTPSTTPISIEKLLEQAKTATTSSTTTTTSTTASTTTTTTTTTTTPKPTTPGVCVDECDLIGTIKLVGGAKWVPELLDRNTKEWQILANEVQSQLEDVFGRSSVLNKWIKKIRIDGFSEGSVLVDYLVELNDLGRQVDTQEIKKLFHESLVEEVATENSGREAKSTDFNRTQAKMEGKLSLGNFIVDPTYTEFIVLPKHTQPTVGFAEDNVLLPQWAIAVIVIGLASLLFVIIFGVTVLVNRQKNAKKRQPTVLTEDMLNELNKNHMSGGIDNYGADDLYNMEDVWNEKAYDTKLPKKRSAGSIHDNSMSNLYDSWRSEWNGYYYNAYYGNNPGSSHNGYGRRRSDYDTNF